MATRMVYQGRFFPLRSHNSGRFSLDHVFTTSPPNHRSHGGCADSTSDRTGSAWYIGSRASSSRQLLAVLSPWPTITAVLWWIIGLAGL